MFEFGKKSEVDFLRTKPTLAKFMQMNVNQELFKKIGVPNSCVYYLLLMEVFKHVIPQLNAVTCSKLSCKSYKLG